MHPSDFFENPPAVVGGRCFVAMPFSVGFSKEVIDTIKSALKKFDIECHRADEVIRGGEVMTDVLNGLATAELVIVDLTERNPNVFYELGIAHTTRCVESVWLLTQHMENVPFDVSHYRCIKYALGNDGLSNLKRELVQAAEKQRIVSDRFVYRWSENKADATSEMILGEDRKLYSFSIRDVIAGDNTAQFRLVVFRHYPGRPPKQVYTQVQKPLKQYETVKVPKLPWVIKLDEARRGEALFCACQPEPKAT
jgi:hypothetical protein